MIQKHLTSKLATNLKFQINKPNKKLQRNTGNARWNAFKMKNSLKHRLTQTELEI